MIFEKPKIMASGPITSWEIDGETVETVADFIFWTPKSLQMVTAAMKLKDAWNDFDFFEFIKSTFTFIKRLLGPLHFLP